MQRSAFSFNENLRQLFHPPNSHFTSIDGLRALSIIWVFAFHVIHTLGEIAPQAFLSVLQRPLAHFVFHGHYGVDVFFVISGFLIGNLLLGEQERTERIDFGRFYMRRIVRLCPVYFFLMSLILVNVAITKMEYPVNYAWANFLYVNNFVPARVQFMAWTWSLAIEEQFYLVCPLLITFLPRQRAVPALVVLLVVGLLIRYAVLATTDPPVYSVLSPAFGRPDFEHFFDVFYDKTYTRYGGLLCGVISAYAFRYTRLIAAISARPFLGVTLFVAALAVIAALFQQYDYAHPATSSPRLFMTVERYLFSASISVILLLSLCTRGVGGWLGRALSLRAFYPVAQLSYSVYLIHPIVLFVGMKSWYDPAPHVPTGMELFVVGLVLGVVTLVGSAMLFLTIEKPGMRMRR